MKKKKSNKLIYAFIDSQNLNLGIKEHGWNLDFKRFRHYLSDKYNVVKAFLFIGYIPGNETLYSNLQEHGYHLIFKPTLKKNNNHIKGNCDAELVLHCMIHLKDFQKSIIISGDGDFHCLIEYLIKEDKLLKIGIPNKMKYSALLRKYSDYMFFINNLRNKLEFINKKEAYAKRRNK